MSTPEVKTGTVDATSRAESRIRELTTKNKELTAQLEAAAPKLAEADKISAKHEKLTAAYKALEARYGEERSLLSAGWSDPDAYDVLRLEYGKLPADDRPAFGDYAKNLRADGAEVPKSLRGYLPASAAVVTEPAKPATPAKREVGGNGNGPAATTGIDAAALKKAEQALRNGDPSLYNALRPAALSRVNASRS